MGFVLVLSVVAVRCGTVRYGTVRCHGLPPPEVREYGTIEYGTVGSCIDSCAAALHVSSLDLHAGLRTPFTCMDLLVSTVPSSGRTVRYGTSFLD